MSEGSQKRTWLGRPARGSRAPIGPGRRRLLVRLGIAVALLVALVVVPDYVATRPSFLRRFPNMEPAYRTWSKSVHAKVACQSCHVSPWATAQVVHGVRMLGEFYASFVVRSRRPELFGKPTNAACSSCHIDLRTVSPSGDLRIPHRAHVDVLKLDCVRCHAYLVHQKSPEGKHLPRMATCLQCHDGRQAKNACSTCHTQKAAPKSHGAADWLIVHPSKQKGIDCTKCHKWRADWCADCHSRRPRSHGVKWRTIHRLQVARRRNCEVCHKAAFCIRCHGEVPALDFDPALKYVE